VQFVIWHVHCLFIWQLLQETCAEAKLENEMEKAMNEREIIKIRKYLLSINNIL
jgi:hypothetical protein